MFDVPVPKILFRDRRKEPWDIGYSVPQVHRAIFEVTRHKLPQAAMALQFARGGELVSPSHTFEATYASPPVQTELPDAEHATPMIGNIIDILFHSAGGTWFISLFLDWRSLKIRHRLVHLAATLEGDLSGRPELLPPLPAAGDELVESGEAVMDQTYIAIANQLLDRLIARTAC